MKVYELVKKLNEYNPNADIDVVVNGFSKGFKICFGGSEGCQPYNCDCVDLTVDTLCEEERDERMTDEEIKKALECCAADNCDECPLFDFPKLIADCMPELLKSAFYLINGQQAEIERLETELKAMRGVANSYKAEIERLEAKFNEYPVKTLLGENNMMLSKSSEDYDKWFWDIQKDISCHAIKEFAERLKKECHNYYPSIDSYCVSRKTVEVKDIDNLAKEITEVVVNNG